jgi:argininosuccinate lyase
VDDNAVPSPESPALTWGGRFREEPHALARRYSASIGVDVRLYRHDITASIAHARMLGKQGIIPAGEAGEIVAGLQRVLADFEDGAVELREELEDIHTHVEARLREVVGEVAGKLHTARSRNDQIATDLRMYTREACDAASSRLQHLRQALATLALEHAAAPMPGYTHLQHAQPVTLGHHLLAYAEMFARDRARFADCRRRLNLLPLGSGALAGSPYPLDREWVARELGFERVTANSMDAVSDRDFVAEFVFAAALTMVHISRLAEEIILWATPEFGFVHLQDAFSTGSSIMPQKKNPDPLELARGKSALAIGSLTSLLALLKGQALTYNRDLQEDKRPLFETADDLLLTLELLTEFLPGLRFDTERLLEQAGAGFSLATAVADYLVGKGMPFRKAHGVAGAIVRFCETEGRDLPQVRLEEYRRFSELFERDVYDILTIESALEARSGVPGSAAPSLVRAAAERILAETADA